MLDVASSRRNKMEKQRSLRARSDLGNTYQKPGEVKVNFELQPEARAKLNKF